MTLMVMMMMSMILMMITMMSDVMPSLASRTHNYFSQVRIAAPRSRYGYAKIQR